MDKLIAGVGEPMTDALVVWQSPPVVGGRSGFLPALNVMEDVAHYALLLRELAPLLTTAFSDSVISDVPPPPPPPAVVVAGDVRQSIIGYGLIRINHVKGITLIWNQQRN